MNKQGVQKRCVLGIPRQRECQTDFIWAKTGQILDLSDIWGGGFFKKCQFLHILQGILRL